MDLCSQVQKSKLDYYHVLADANRREISFSEIAEKSHDESVCEKDRSGSFHY